MGWYKVVKTIKRRKYLYLQQTYRVGNKVKTRNKYLGPAGGGGGYATEPRSSETIRNDLEEARVHRDILKDVISQHAVRRFLKYRGRTDRQSLGGTSFVELNAQALETGREGKHLDTMLSEAGYADFDELDAAVEEYHATKEQLQGAQARLNKLRKEQAEARAHHRTLGPRPTPESKVRTLKVRTPRKAPRARASGGLQLSKIHRSKQRTLPEREPRHANLEPADADTEKGADDAAPS